jgi:hypothetical protein
MCFSSRSSIPTSKWKRMERESARGVRKASINQRAGLRITWYFYLACGRVMGSGLGLGLGLPGISLTHSGDALLLFRIAGKLRHGLEHLGSGCFIARNVTNPNDTVRRVPHICASNRIETRRDILKVFPFNHNHRRWIPHWYLHVEIQEVNRRKERRAVQDTIKQGQKKKRTKGEDEDEDEGI